MAGYFEQLICERVHLAKDLDGNFDADLAANLVTSIKTEVASNPALQSVALPTDDTATIAAIMAGNCSGAGQAMASNVSTQPINTNDFNNNIGRTYSDVAAGVAEEMEEIELDKVLDTYFTDLEFEDDNPCLSTLDYYKGLKDGFSGSWSDLYEAVKSLGELETYQGLYEGIRILTCPPPCSDAEIALKQVKMLNNIGSFLTSSVHVLDCHEEGRRVGKLFTDIIAGEAVAITSSRALKLIAKASEKAKIRNVVESGLAQGVGNTTASLSFWSRNVVFRGIKIYQRNDLINPNTVSSWIERGITKTGTNVERMRSGRAAIGSDGKSINLHHLIQIDGGSLAEITATFHQRYTTTIHINPNTIPSGINRAEFSRFVSDYWIQRALDF